MYAECTAGRTEHIRHIPYNFDRSSATYLYDRPVLRNDDRDPSFLCIGTTRLPQSKRELSLVLWRFWDMDPPSADLEETEDQFLQRLEHKMNALDQVVFHETLTILACHHYYSANDISIEDEGYKALWECPIWVESAETIFYCTQKKSIVEHIVTILQVQRKLRERYRIGTSRFEYREWKRKFRKGAVCPLPEAVRRMEVLRDGGVKLVVMAFQLSLAMMETMPWYPCLWYMDAWESQLNGIADVMFECNNLASYALTKIGLYDLADKMTALVHKSHCRTAKQLAYAHTRRLLNGKARVDKRREYLSVRQGAVDADTAKMQKERFSLSVMNANLRQRPPGEIAHPHWYENFSPDMLITYCTAAAADGGAVRSKDAGPYKPWVDYWAEVATRTQFNFRTLGDKYWTVMQRHVCEPKDDAPTDPTYTVKTPAELIVEAQLKTTMLREWGYPAEHPLHAAPLKRSRLSWKHLAGEMTAHMDIKELWQVSQDRQQFAGETGLDFAAFQETARQLLDHLTAPGDSA